MHNKYIKSTVPAINKNIQRLISISLTFPKFSNLQISCLNIKEPKKCNLLSLILVISPSIHSKTLLFLSFQINQNIVNRIRFTNFIPLKIPSHAEVSSLTDPAIIQFILNKLQTIVQRLYTTAPQKNMVTRVQKHISFIFYFFIHLFLHCFS